MEGLVQIGRWGILIVFQGRHENPPAIFAVVAENGSFGEP